MKAIVVVSPIGVLAFEGERLIEKALFKKDSKFISRKLNATETGKTIIEVLSIVRKLKRRGYLHFTFENMAIAESVNKKLNVEVSVATSSVQEEPILLKTGRLAVEAGFAKKPEEIKGLLREVSLELTRLRVRRAGEKRDLMVAQSILTIDDLDRTVNLFIGRVREWYGLHFPELDRIIENHETYARLVVNLGRRSHFTAENLMGEKLTEKTATLLADSAVNSMGARLEENDIKQIQTLSTQVLDLYSLRQTLQKYAESTISDVAPNLQALVGSLLAARLIALAGGLTNLAKMPASTVQVLGAEKALFRALKTGARPPKHGVIFQDTLVHDAKRWQRGKMSRALAGKLAIAARTDAFSGRFIGDSLRADLEKRVEEIKQKYRSPPPPRKQKPGKRKSGRTRRKKRGRKR